jgi:polysaccharide biosynthesis/export protein
MRSVARVKVGLAASLLGAVLTGCSGSGPSNRDLVSASAQVDASFVLVDIDDRTLALAGGSQTASFSAVFGDYRRAEVQRVGVGDSVQINIWESGSGGLFSTPATDRLVPGSRLSAIPEQVVARDGTVNVPFAGRIKVSDQTPQEIEARIVAALKGKAADPQAIVTLSRNTTNTVTVTGDVTNGARLPLGPQRDKLLDVIAQAGGIRSPLHETFIAVSRTGTSLTVPMQAILANTRENINIRPGDLITVYRVPQSFTAVGATGRNAVVNFDAIGITLEEAMGKAGGLLDERSDPSGLFVLRYEPVALVRQFKNVPQRLLDKNVVPVAYRLDVKDAASLFRARRFAMRDKDILYVSNAPVSEVEKVFRVVGTLTSPAVTAATVRSAAK